MKTCAKCELVKDLEDFSIDRRHKDGRVSRCKPCDARDKRSYREKNPERMQDLDFRRNYGITLIQYNEMVMAQCGLCAVCDQPESKVVALVCNACNLGMGKLGDSPDRMRRAALIHEGG